MSLVALRVSKSDGANGSVGQGPEIALSLRQGVHTGQEAGRCVASYLLGCSLLYPHSRLVIDLTQLSVPNADLLDAIERHRGPIEARGGSLRVNAPVLSHGTF
ncbi:MAG: hypothetical protein FJY92_01580 [Candidatus Hydrogenedentes bacterium]|nr:hypothetical protein [Candidatus Hydrogenedentota bacterium]